MIICSSSHKPFSYTAKMTARRQATIKEYSNEIDALYEVVSRGSQSRGSTQNPLPEEWNLDKTTAFVRRTVQAVVKGSFADDADLFQCGCDRYGRLTSVDLTAELTVSEVSKQPGFAILSSALYHKQHQRPLNISQTPLSMSSRQSRRWLPTFAV